MGLGTGVGSFVVAVALAIGCGDDATGEDGGGRDAGRADGGGGDGAVGEDAGLPEDAGPVPSCSALECTTVGTLTLRATFDAISVRATFSGDADGDNGATMRWREAGSSEWHEALPPIVDRRTMVGGDPNPYVSQMRGSIVGLDADGSYEVELTYTDPDGFSGRPVVIGTVSTLPSVAPLGGGELYVDDVVTGGNGSAGSPFNSIPDALAAASAGDTIHVRPGSYPAFTVSVSGTESAYVAIVGDDRDGCLIEDGGSENISIDADHVQIRNLRLLPSQHHGIEVLGGRHHVWIENVYLEDVGQSESYDDAGVFFAGDNHHCYLLDSVILAPTLLAAPTPTPRWESPAVGIFVGPADPQGTFVIRGNRIDGGFRDCIGNSPESLGGGVIDNSDIAGNTITSCKDDAIQMEGDDVNLRIWQNVVLANNGYSAVATQPNVVGPVYVFRNLFVVSWDGEGGYVGKLGETGFAFWIHNTLDTMPGMQRHDGLAGASANQVVWNNIIATSGSPLWSMPSDGSRYDGNLYYRDGGGDIVGNHGGSGDYATIGDFRTATGQEASGAEGDPRFLDAQRHIDATSPAHDGAVAIPNFNGPDSAWPIAGAAPDRGYYEAP